MAEIGIKLADGSFFPILDDSAPARKRVVLTTAREQQDNVQIDLIRQENDVIEHVGFLLLEDLGESDEGARELSLTIGIDASGNLDAQIATTDDSQYQSFAVNVHELEGSGSFDMPDVASTIGDVEVAEDLDDLEMPDFDLDSDTIDAGGFEESVGDEYDLSYDSPIDDDGNGYEYETEAPQRRFSVPVLIAILLIALSLIALAAYGVFSLLEAEALPELRAFLLIPAVPGIRRRTR